MKKLFLMIAVAALSAQTMSAQTVEGSKTTDNWYIGINGGVAAPAKGYKVLKNIDALAGLRIGHYWTPVQGVAVEGQAYFMDKPFEVSKTAVKAINVSLLGTTNLSNWFGGYKGEPRTLEVVALYGLGWGHGFGGFAPEGKQNFVTSKFALDFAFNLGAAKAVQLYIEPNIVYGMNFRNRFQYNLNQAVLGVNVGLNYKFGNSNGTHNFKLAELRDQAEIDALNAKINDLRGALNGKDGELAAKNRQIADLQAALEACKNKKPETIVVNEKENVLAPVVIFRQGKSTVDAAQFASVEMVAKYLKNHKDSKVLLKGYASPEGNAELNQKLSEARATAVKNALVKRYKIAADRITTQGLGATDKLSDELDFNRVVTFTDTTK